MNSMEGTARVVEAFESRVQRRTSQSQLSLKMGHARSFLVKALGHERGPRTADMLQGLIAAGDELPGDLYHQAFEKPAGEPALILACNRRRQGLPPNPFLVELAPRLLAIAERGIAGDGGGASELGRILELERLRFQDRTLCIASLENFVRESIERLDGANFRSARAMAELAIALSALAAVYRSQGLLDDALDALLLAYPLMTTADDPFAEGIWYRKAGYLLSYLGRYDRAYEFVEEAATHFIEASSQEELAKTLVDIGFVLSCAGFGEEARRRLRRALKVLPPVDDEYMFAVHQILAYELANAGQLLEAIFHLEKASEFTAQAKFLLGLTYWSRAKLWAKQGKMKAAARSFRLALQLNKSHGNPTDVAELTFEYAGLLVMAKDRLELENLVAGTSNFLATISCDLRIREAVEDLVAMIQMKKQITPRFLEQLRTKIAPATAREGGLPDPLIGQPPGGHCTPISSSAAVSALLFDGKFVPGSPTAV